MAWAAKITGIGSAYPEKVLTNDELVRDLAEKGIETSDEWIRERTGILQRRISNVKDPKEQNSSLGTAAAKRALEMAGKKPEDIDQILYATCSPDMLIPSTACLLQEKLGAKNAWALDLNAACSGFVFALSIADQFIRTGQVKTSLIIGSEVLSSFVNWEDRGTCLLFGDGAGAAIVERTDVTSESRILSTHLSSEGNYDMFHVPASGSNMEVTQEVRDQKLDKIFMKGREIFKNAVRTLDDFARIALKANGFEASDLDWLVPHQANLRIIEAAVKRLNFPMEKVLVNLDRFGNTSSATVPTVLDENVRSGKIKPGDLILLDVFGAGLTYGSALMRW